MQKINLFKNKFSKGFTLVEMLIVVLIIGILVAIAVPQYQKVIYKSRLNKGISLVESLYQAQQAYYMSNGKFANDIDDLDLSLPLNDSCVKTQSSKQSKYKCDFGTIGIFDSNSNIQFQAKPSYNAYVHFFKNYKHTYLGNMTAGQRACLASWRENHPSRQTCIDMGGEYKGTQKSNWSYYKIQ